MNETALQHISLANHSRMACTCKLCGRETVQVLYRSQRYGFQVGRWWECDIFFVLEQVPEEALKEMYSDEHVFLPFATLMNNTKVRQHHEDLLGRIKSWLHTPLGRFHPKKGVDILLQAFPQVIRNRDFHLLVVGPDSTLSNMAKLQSLVIPLGMEKKVTFWGPAYGSQK